MSATAPPPDDLDALRARIRQLDRDLVALAAERVRLAREIGEVKRRAGLAVVDYAQERQVLERATAAAAEHGLDAGVAGDLLAGLIRASVTVQEAENLRHAATGQGKVAVVVGGAGRMGRWMGRFLAAQGWEVAVVDPAAAPEDDRRGRAALPSADLVVVATPPRETARRYADWAAGDAPPGWIVDIASIKTPLLAPIAGLRRAGARVASIHPMFGPSAVLLRDHDVVVCETGDEPATAAAEALFRPTTARLVRLPLAEHDRIMADLLSLAHASALAFSLALPESGHPVRSATFQALLGRAEAVVRESPQVYYEIQAENPHSAGALERLAAAVERLRATVVGRREEEFAGLMREGRRRTGGEGGGGPGG